MNTTGQAGTLSTKPRRALIVLIGVAVFLAVSAVIVARAWGEQGLRGKYAGQDGISVLEFRGSRVYVTSALGTTYVATYELDGDRVIVKGAGGAQVYTRTGNTLDGGVGIRFVKGEEPR